MSALAKRRGTQTPHVYEGGRLTADRISRFANAPQDEQIAALAELHARSTAITGSQLAGVGVFIAVMVAVWSLLTSVQELGDPFWGEWFGIETEITDRIGWFAFELLIFGALAFGAYAMGRSLRQEARSVAFARAYEAELSRRYAARGRHARQWRAAHPISWSPPPRRRRGH